MRTMSRFSRLAIPLLVAGALAGCTVDGAAIRGPIDLDTGVYGARQSPAMNPASSDLSWRHLNSIRLAEYIVMPAEIDPAFARLSMPTRPLWDAAQLSMTFVGSGRVRAVEKMTHGTVIAAGEREGAPVDVGLNHAVLVFPDERSASEATANLAQLSAQPSELTSEYRPIRLPGMASTSRVAAYRSGTETVLTALTPVGRNMIYTWVSSPDQQQRENVIRTAYQKQAALLAKVPAGRGDPNPDPLKLMTGTVRADDKSATPLSDAVFSARGAALFSDAGPKTLEALTKAGITQVAMSDTQVMKAGSPAQANEYVKYLAADFADETSRKAATPRDLPGATCLTRDSRAACFVVVGDYIAEAYGKDLLTAQQLVSASYQFLGTR